MSDEIDCVEGEGAANRFRALAKRVITTPKPAEKDEAEEPAEDAAAE